REVSHRRTTFSCAPHQASLLFFALLVPAPVVAQGDGEEVFCDPENPACRQADQREDDALELEIPEEIAAPAAPSATVRAGFGTTLWVDTRMQAPAQGEGGQEDYVEWGSALDLGVEVEVRPGLDVVVYGQLRHWMGGRDDPERAPILVNASGVRAEYEARLGEAYVAWRTGPWSLRAGNLKTTWGATQLVRPGDVFNPRDQRTFGQSGPAASDGKLPQLTAEVAYLGASWSATALVMPFFETDRVVAFGRDSGLLTPWSPLNAQLPLLGLAQQALDPSAFDDVQPILLGTNVPDERPRAADVGARVAATLWNTDLGLGYAYTWDRTPYVRVDPAVAALLGVLAEDELFFEEFDFIRLAQRNPQVLLLSQQLSMRQAAGEEVLVNEYRRRHTLVVDIARYIGPVGVRVDAAVTPAQVFPGADLNAVRRPSLGAALGLSYEGADLDRPLAIQLEGFWLQPAGASSAVTRRFVPEQERGAAREATQEEGVVDEAEILIIGDGLYGVSAGCSWATGWWGLRVQLGGVWTVSNGDVIANGSITKRLRNGLGITLGANVFEGPPLEERFTLGGLYDRNDQVFTALDLQL
ncbi:MAG: DUF1302 family protein, partial [Myxococcota bacterium]